MHFPACGNLVSNKVVEIFIWVYLIIHNSQSSYINSLLMTITSTVIVALSLPIGLVTVHVYVPLSLVVTLLME